MLRPGSCVRRSKPEPDGLHPSLLPAGNRRGHSSATTRMLLVTPSFALGWWGALSAAYLIGLLLAARTLKGEPEASGPRVETLPRLMVFVPAHDEESVIGETVSALLNADYPQERRQIIVVADNCHDTTASVAGLEGAEVWERDEPDRPGKGRAIAWALGRASPSRHDAVVIVDADCIASQNLLVTLGAAIGAGADAVQAQYVASNPTAAPAAALRYAGFALMNSVRPLAKSKLGLSAGLLGTGMAFPVRTLEEVPWTAFSVTEDREYHLRLVEAGLAVRFAERAWVSSPMPATAAGGAAQQTRWDTGNALLARRFLLRLLARGIRGRSPDAVHAALELLIPPQTLLAAIGTVTVGAGVGLRARGLRALGSFALTAQVAYVVAGLRLVGAPPAVFRALSCAPALIARRAAQHALIFSGRGSRAWVRTERAR